MSNETEKMESNVLEEIGDVKTAIISELGDMRSNLIRKIDGVQTGIDSRADSLLTVVTDSKWTAAIVIGVVVGAFVLGAPIF